MIEEIKANGYNSIKEVQKDFNRAHIAIQKYNGFENLNNAGTVRIALHIANPNYQLFFDKSGKIFVLTESTLKEYEECRKYLTKSAV
ncbi:hypothetical protein [Desertivirga arenae]|uniref:hypothetical protein n=1 Tax=Desertivirga arenae TaxID=2810309 RepID=UPI001A9627C5|nr:hypothetical protein [Pedobacter sp. SYSU D00823]